MIDRLWRRLQQLVGRARVAAVDDSGPTQKIQLKGAAPGEVIDGVRRIAEYGFTSNPPLDSDAIVIFPAGERSNGVIIGTNNQTWRLRNLGAGDVAMHDNRGRSIRMTADGLIISGGTEIVQIESNGDVSVVTPGRFLVRADGGTEFTGPVTANGKRIDDTHEHGGVTIGSGITGTPT